MTDFSVPHGNQRVITVTITNLPAAGLANYAILFTGKTDLSQADGAAPGWQKRYPGNADLSILQLGGGSPSQPGIVQAILQAGDTVGLSPDQQTAVLWDMTIIAPGTPPMPETVDSGTITVTPHATDAIT